MDSLHFIDLFKLVVLDSGENFLFYFKWQSIKIYFFFSWKKAVWEICEATDGKPRAHSNLSLRYWYWKRGSTGGDRNRWWTGQLNVLYSFRYHTPVLSLIVPVVQFVCVCWERGFVRRQFRGVGSFFPPWLSQGWVMWLSGLTVSSVPFPPESSCLPSSFDFYTAAWNIIKD